MTEEAKEPDLLIPLPQLTITPLFDYHVEYAKRFVMILEEASLVYAKTHDSAEDYPYFLQRWLEDRPSLIEDILRGEDD